MGVILVLGAGIGYLDLIVPGFGIGL